MRSRDIATKTTTMLQQEGVDTGGLSSLPLQVVIYFSGWYLVLFYPALLAALVYKGQSHVYFNSYCHYCIILTYVRRHGPLAINPFGLVAGTGLYCTMERAVYTAIVNPSIYMAIVVSSSKKLC